MKLLIIGMDGVSYDTFERGWTPFISSLVGRGERLSVEEDLISRGWSEISTGEHGIHTGALYERPTLGRTYGWTESFKLSDIPGLGEKIKPFWQVVNDFGYKVGVMNVPTTYPAPNVDGFFVSGGGGGGPVNQMPTIEQCSDKDVYDFILSNGYIVDERFGSLLGEKKLYEVDRFINRLEEKVVKRASAFLSLSLARDIQCGFLVFKSATVAAESIVLPEIKKLKSGGPANQDLIDGVERLYRTLDDQIKMLVNKFPQANILLVSDHSTVNKVADVNLNVLLRDGGFQRVSASRGFVYRLVRSIKHLVPYRIKAMLKSRAGVKRAYESMVTFDAKETVAFSMSLSNGVHGIYINDMDRFGGPVGGEKVGETASNIASYLNGERRFIEEGFVAEVVNKYGAGIESNQYPDIVVKMPDGYQTSALGKEFITPYKFLEKKLTLRELENDMSATMKGRTPLAVSINGAWEVGAERRKDLTAVYYHIVNVMRR